MKRIKDLKIYVKRDGGVSRNDDVEQGLSGVIAVGGSGPGFREVLHF